jgi:hypothetical protein
MRLNRKRLKLYKLKKKNIITDKNGYTSADFSSIGNISAEVYPSSNHLQSDIYGNKTGEILNMLYDGNEEINIGDYVNISETDYRVISKKTYTKHSAFELEVCEKGAV